MSFTRTYAALRKYIADLPRHHSELADERGDAFPFWFCQASLCHPDDTNEILRSLVGRNYDKNIDVIAYSPLSRDVYICQTKYRDSLGKVSEKPNDLNAFARIAGAFTEKTKVSFLGRFPQANADVRERLLTAWSLVREQKYGLQLFYVTTGKISTYAVDEARATCGALNADAHFITYGGHDCCRLFEDFQSLVPAIPYVDFQRVRDRMSAHSSDGTIQSVVFAARATQLKGVFLKHGERLFARNVRLDKGETISVNSQIAESLREEPHYFLYYNNGLTLLGRSVDVTDSPAGGGFNVRIYEPQIINGQQTTRTIAKGRNLAPEAEVLVRVVCREPRSDQDIDAFRHFIGKVVRATNSQTKVAASELASNNPEHINLERAFKHLNWRYVRKVGKSDQTSPVWQGKKKPYGSIKLKELATALVCCLKDPHYIRREGIEKLFEQSSDSRALYASIYSKGREDSEYLFCYLLLQLAERTNAVKSKQRRQLESLGQYYVAHRLHKELIPLYRKATDPLLEALGGSSFKRQYPAHIQKLKDVVVMSWHSFFNDKREADEDPLSFVTTTATQKIWNSYWQSRSNATRRRQATQLLIAINRTLARS